MKDNPIAAGGLSKLVLEDIPITDSNVVPPGINPNGAIGLAIANGNREDISKANSSRKKRLSTRENIERLVKEGAKSYPAYLKLVHTGESDVSDFSSDEEQKGSNFVKYKPFVSNVATVSVGNGDNNPGVDYVNGDGGENEVNEHLGDERVEGHLYISEHEIKNNAAINNELENDSTYQFQSAAEYDNAQNMQKEPTEQEKEEWRIELSKLEEDIMTLRQVLGSKIRESQELKQKLGITPMSEIKGDFKQGLQNIKESTAYIATSEKLTELNSKIVESTAYKRTSDSLHNASEKISSTEAYQKTNETFKVVGTRTASMFSTLGAFTSRKIGDARNSNAFKSFEEKMGGAYSNMKATVTGSQSDGEIIATASGGRQNEDDGTTEVPLNNTSTASTPLPEEKVPL